MKQQFTFLTTLMYCVQAFAQDTNTSDTSNSYILYATIAVVFTIIWLLNAKYKKRTKVYILCVYFILFGIFGIVGLFSNSSKNEAEQLQPIYNQDLIDAVEDLNSQFPLKIAEGIYAKKYELKDSCLIDTIDIDEKKYPYEDFLENKVLKKHIMLNNIAKNSPFVHCTFSDFANKGISVKTVIRGIQSHREIIFVMTPSEILKAQSTNNNQDEDQLQIYLSHLKRSLPSKIDEGITLSNAEIINDKFVMTYLINEKVYDMKEAYKKRKEFEHNIKEDFLYGRTLFKLGTLLVPLKMSFSVIYAGSITKEQIHIDIPASYIQQVVSNNSQN